MKKNLSPKWTIKQIKYHTEAGRMLGLVKDDFQRFLAKPKTALTEIDCVKFIKKAYGRHGLFNDNPKESCIVAFGEHTREVHYFASKTKNSKLKSDTLILLDIWARIDETNAPYADATFMFYKDNPKTSKDVRANKIPKEMQGVWKVLVEARDTAIGYIKKEIKKGRMPRGIDIDRVTHDVIGNAGLGRGIKHTIGHSLGLNSPHGELPGINWREYSPILKNVGYTIEPGIYLEKFGMRSEIDFYINSNYKIIITTNIQKNLDELTL